MYIFVSVINCDTFGNSSWSRKRLALYANIWRITIKNCYSIAIDNASRGIENWGKMGERVIRFWLQADSFVLLLPQTSMQNFLKISLLLISIGPSRADRHGKTLPFFGAGNNNNGIGLNKARSSIADYPDECHCFNWCQIKPNAVLVNDSGKLEMKHVSERISQPTVKMIRAVVNFSASEASVKDTTPSTTSTTWTGCSCDNCCTPTTPSDRSTQVKRIASRTKFLKSPINWSSWRYLRVNCSANSTPHGAAQ